MAIKKQKKQKFISGEISSILKQVGLLIQSDWIVVSHSISADALPNAYTSRTQYLSVLLEKES